MFNLSNIFISEY